MLDEGNGGQSDLAPMISHDAAAVLSNATSAPMIDLEVLRAYQVGDQVTLALGGKNDLAFGGGP